MLSVLLTLALSLQVAPAAKVDNNADFAAAYRGHIIVRVDLASQHQYTSAQALGGRFLAETQQLGQQLVMLSPEDQSRWALSATKYTIINHDVEAAIVNERARLARPQAAHADFFAEFQDFASIDSHLGELVASATKRVQRHVLGKSLEERDIPVLEIGGNNGNEKPAILLNGTIHAREWLSPMTMMYIAQRLVDDYESDERVQYILDRTRVFVVPVLNVDGFLYSWETDRYWRKNRRDGHGVDLNRNWGAYWQGDSDTSSETYPGSAGFSEPETQAWRDFAKALPKVVAFIDWHTPIELVMCPYFGSDSPPHHAQEHKDWSKEISDGIASKHNKQYGNCAGYDTKAKGGGVSIDWFVTEEDDGLGAMGWLVEMRGPDFVVDPSEILPNAEENYEGFLRAMTHVAETFGDDSVDPGDDDSSGTSDSNTTTDGSNTDDTSSTTADTSEQDSASDTGNSQQDSSSKADASGDSGDDQSTSASSQGSGEVGSDDSNSGGDSTGNGADDEPKAGGCSASAGSAATAWLVGLPLVFAWRRRRRRIC